MEGFLQRKAPFLSFRNWNDSEWMFIERTKLKFGRPPISAPKDKSEDKDKGKKKRSSFLSLVGELASSNNNKYNKYNKNSTHTRSNSGGNKYKPRPSINLLELKYVGGHKYEDAVPFRAPVSAMNATQAPLSTDNKANTYQHLHPNFPYENGDDLAYTDEHTGSARRSRASTSTATALIEAVTGMMDGQLNSIPTTSNKIHLLFQNGERMTLKAPTAHEANMWINALSWFTLLEPFRPVPIPGILARVLRCCLAFLVEHGKETEGVFRLGGSQQAQRRMFRELYIEGRTEINADECVHSVASLAKTLMRRFPETLLTDNLFQSFLQAAEFEQLPMTTRLVAALPAINRLILAELMHVCTVLTAHPKTRMSYKSLAVLIGPNLLMKVDADDDLEMKKRNSNNEDNSHHSNKSSSGGKGKSSSRSLSLFTRSSPSKIKNRYKNTTTPTRGTEAGRRVSSLSPSSTSSITPAVAFPRLESPQSLDMHTYVHADMHTPGNTSRPGTRSDHESNGSSTARVHHPRHALEPQTKERVTSYATSAAHSTHYEQLKLVGKTMPNLFVQLMDNMLSLFPFLPSSVEAQAILDQNTKPVPNVNLTHGTFMHVLSYLDAPSLATVAVTCAQLRGMTEDEGLWLALCAHHGIRFKESNAEVSDILVPSTPPSTSASLATSSSSSSAPTTASSSSSSSSSSTSSSSSSSSAITVTLSHFQNHNLVKAPLTSHSKENLHNLYHHTHAINMDNNTNDDTSSGLPCTGKDLKGVTDLNLHFQHHKHQATYHHHRCDVQRTHLEGDLHSKSHMMSEKGNDKEVFTLASLPPSLMTMSSRSSSASSLASARSLHHHHRNSNEITNNSSNSTMNEKGRASTQEVGHSVTVINRERYASVSVKQHLVDFLTLDSLYSLGFKSNSSSYHNLRAAAAAASALTGEQEREGGYDGGESRASKPLVVGNGLLTLRQDSSTNLINTDSCDRFDNTDHQQHHQNKSTSVPSSSLTHHFEEEDQMHELADPLLHVLRSPLYSPTITSVSKLSPAAVPCHSPSTPRRSVRHECIAFHATTTATGDIDPLPAGASYITAGTSSESADNRVCGVSRDGDDNHHDNEANASREDNNAHDNVIGSGNDIDEYNVHSVSPGNSCTGINSGDGGVTGSFTGHDYDIHTDNKHRERNESREGLEAERQTDRRLDQFGR